jgi:hypothetical protein
MIDETLSRGQYRSVLSTQYSVLKPSQRLIIVSGLIYIDYVILYLCMNYPIVSEPQQVQGLDVKIVSYKYKKTRQKIKTNLNSNLPVQVLVCTINQKERRREREVTEKNSLRCHC